jgi:hypothetical protein
MQKGFCKLGIIAGITQIIVNLGFAFQGKAAPEQSSPPVRISRTALYESKLEGSVILLSGISQKNPQKWDSSVTWTQQPTQLPGPTHAFQADYRDFKGCLEYGSLGNLAVCFNVMPDVSSVGVNEKELEKEMTLQSIANFMTEELDSSNCTVDPSSIKLAKAIRSAAEYTIEFQGNCSQNPITLQINLKVIN